MQLEMVQAQQVIQDQQAQLGHGSQQQCVAAEIEDGFGEQLEQLIDEEELIERKPELEIKFEESLK